MRDGRPCGRPFYFASQSYFGGSSFFFSSGCFGG
jgi:hypothetical protein